MNSLNKTVIFRSCTNAQTYHREIGYGELLDNNKTKIIKSNRMRFGHMFPQGSLRDVPIVWIENHWNLQPAKFSIAEFTHVLNVM